MKHILFALFFSLSTLVFAQGRRENQSSIHVQYGFNPSKDDLKAGKTILAGYARAFGNKGFMGKVEGFYQDFEVGYLNNQILPYKKYGLNINAGYSYEGFYPVMINAWAGGFGGYQDVNGGDKTAPITKETIQEDVKGFVYGISGSLEGEVFLTRKLSLLASYSQFYDLKSKFSKSNYGFFGGLRFYID